MGFLLRMYYFLFGYYRVRCDEAQKGAVLNLFVQKKIPVLYDTEFSWCVSVFHKSELEKAAKGVHLSLKIGEIEGFPAVAWRFRKRIGLVVGVLFALFIVFWAESVVWRVEVIGNEKIPAESIRLNLQALGFGEGANKKEADFLELSNAYRLRHQEIAHMDIYCVGTVAYVHVIESEHGGKEGSEGVGNLIASKDAVIHSIDVLHGKVVVKEGEVVKKGDLLVNGVVDGAHESRLLMAEGSVYGTVTEEILIEIPYKQKKEAVKETRETGFAINFFGKTIKFHRNTGNLPPTYGTIVKRDVAVMPSGKTLPFSLLRYSAVICEEGEEILSETEALRLAFAKLKGKISALTKNGYLISKETTAQAMEDMCIVKCTIVYVTDIAEKQAILIP